MTTTPIPNAQDPVYPQKPKMAACVTTAVKTTYNDTANAVLLLTAGEHGCEVTCLGATPRATVTATQIQYYVMFDGDTAPYLLGTELMAAWPVAPTTQTPTTYLTQGGSKLSDTNVIRLPPLAKLYAAQSVASSAGIVHVAQYRDF